jgi:CRP-like cAMP-binding protein
MFTDRFLKGRRGVSLDDAERQRLERAVIEVRDVGARHTIIRAGERLYTSTMLVEGIMCRYIDDRDGLRQLVAVHVPGDFVDLHAYPLRTLDHDLATLTAVRIALVPHNELDAINAELPELTRKLWFSTLLDAAIHRAWLFRLGRLDAVSRVAHFFCETNLRMMSAGLSDGTRFHFDITQLDLAEICGLTSVHVNRVLRQLREDRLCSFRSGIVEIHDMGRLIRQGQFDPAYLYMHGEAA